jgi:hypothetical protein
MTVLSYTPDIMADRGAFEKASQDRKSAVDLSGTSQEGGKTPSSISSCLKATRPLAETYRK